MRLWHSWNCFDWHLYPGGAWRIHMLRRMMGDECFWEAVSAYVQQYDKQLVETVNFQTVLEQHSHLNLTRFFDQWIYGRGYPKLKGTYEFDATKKIVSLKLEQTQVSKERYV